MRCVTYHRVSTLDQNVSTARDELRRAAAQRGYEVVDEFEETGSGARNDRPELQRLMAMARKGKFDAVLVWKLDRFGRSSLDVQTNIRQLNQCGVSFVAVTQGIEAKPHGDAMSNLILSVMAAMAEFELDLIRDRTRAGMARAKAQGTRSGKLIGGQWAYARPDAARVRALRAAGRSWAQVAAELGCSVGSARKAAA